MRPEHLKSAKELGGDKPHGTRIKYMSGCHCLPCRAANSSYETERAALRRLGLDNGIISAAKTRSHLQELARQGIGRRTVAELTGIPQSSIYKINKGIKENIRKDTERRILAVTFNKAAKNKTIIDADPVWTLINRLLKQGFTKTALAQRLGLGRSLQLNKSRITVKNAIRVKHFYDMVMTG